VGKLAAKYKASRATPGLLAFTLRRPSEALTLFPSIGKAHLNIAMLSSLIFALALGGSNVAFAATTTYPARPTFSTIEPALSAIRAAQATAIPSSPTSNVKGKAFDRIIHIWLENTVG
jgi:hypothetical protein